MTITKHNKPKMVILSLLERDENKKRFKEIEKEWEKYFEFEQIFDKASNAKKYFDKKIDILFIAPENFQGHYYDEFKKNNPTFSYNAVVKKININKDIETYMYWADRIIYTDETEEFFKWSSIASLRRYWEAYSKPGMVIYKDIMADFIENRFTLSGQKIELTTKEVDLLRFLLKKRNQFIDKKTIFKEVWGFEETDATRTVDQMIFKLKRKLGTKYFEIKRNQGVKFG